MKPSRMALLSLGGIVAAIIVVIAVATRVTFGQGGQVGERVGAQVGSSPGELPAFSHDLSGFDSIEINGRWTVVVTQGDEWQVELDYPETGTRDVDVSVHGERLRLSGARSGSLFGRSDARLTANVVMPALVELETAGENRVTFSGFEGDHLSIESAGATDMTGADCRYARLDLSMAGAGNAQLKGIVVTDADIEVAGATNVSLTMDGGELTGGLAGAGRIEYSGTVSREAVDVAGFGWVGPASQAVD